MSLSCLHSRSVASGADAWRARACALQFFKLQTRAKRGERESMLAKLAPDQRERLLGEEAAAAVHDAAKSRHVLKTTSMFRAGGGGNPLALGGGGRGRHGRGGGSFKKPPAAATTGTADGGEDDDADPELVGDAGTEV